MFRISLTSSELTEVAGRDFDRRAAVHLMPRYPELSQKPLHDVLAWIADERHWLDQRGFHAEQHIVDHFEIILENGREVVHHPDYLAIVQRPLWSAEERMVRLRHRFLKENTDG